MSIREHIDIIEAAQRHMVVSDQLNEKVHMTPIFSARRELPVYENPSQTQVRNLLDSSEFGSARMIIDSEGRLFIWDASLSDHYKVANALGIKAKYNGYIDQRGITLRGTSRDLPAIRHELQQAPAIMHAMGNDVSVGLH